MSPRHKENGEKYIDGTIFWDLRLSTKEPYFVSWVNCHYCCNKYKFYIGSNTHTQDFKCKCGAIFQFSIYQSGIIKININKRD